MLRQKDSKISLLEYQLARVTHDLFQSRELSLRGKSIPKESYSCVSNIPKNLCGGAKGNNTNSANNICNDSYEFSGSSTSSYQNNESDDSKENVIISAPMGDGRGEKRKIDSDEAGPSRDKNHNSLTKRTGTNNHGAKEINHPKLLADVLSMDVDDCEIKQTLCKGVSIHTSTDVTNSSYAGKEASDDSSLPYKCMKIAQK